MDCQDKHAGESLVRPEHPLKIFEVAKANKKLVYACAPMVRYSKLAFRQTVFHYNTDLSWTPMILAKEFNRSHFARDSDFTISTHGPQPPTIVQFGANSPLELSRASSLVAPYVSGVDLNCGCPQSWACAETLGAALMDQRELVRDMVVSTRNMLRNDGWAVDGRGNDTGGSPQGDKGKSVSVKIRVHKDLRRTVDFIETVLGDDHLNRRNVDFLTIHPRTRQTPSSTPINTEALEMLVDKYGDVLPIMLSGDVFDLASLPFRTPYLSEKETFTCKSSSSSDPDPEPRPYLPKLAGVMSARGLLANPALFAGHPVCPWEAVDFFMNKVVQAPLPFRLVQHHLTEMCGPGMGSNKSSLLSKKERVAMQECGNMCELIDFLDEKARSRGRVDGIARHEEAFG